jgi:hypothetical protein
MRFDFVVKCFFIFFLNFSPRMLQSVCMTFSSRGVGIVSSMQGICPGIVSSVSTQHWRTQGGVFGGFKPPRSFEKAWPNSQFRGIYICNNLSGIRVLLIYKLSDTSNQGATAPRSPFCLPSVLSCVWCWGAAGGGGGGQSNPPNTPLGTPVDL